MIITLHRIVCFVFPFLTAVSSQNASIPLEHLCTRRGFSAIKVDDDIYIFGGIRDRKVFKETYPNERSLLKLDMSHSWYAYPNGPNLTPVTFSNASDGPPSTLIYGSIFHDPDGKFHIYGGGAPALNATSKQPIAVIPVPSKLWTASDKNGSWSPSAISIPGIEYAPMYGLSAQAPEHDLAFYFNGIVRNGSSEQAYPGMIVFNTRTKDARVVNTDDISRSTTRVGAALQYVPLLGKKGALVLFGGATRYNENITTDPWGTMEPLNMMHVLDIASLDSTPDGVWYSQRISGRTPEPRLITCAVPILSPDKTNYYIYMFAGRSPSGAYGDVWVLSLPQFRWTQVVGGGRLNYGATCHMVGKKQMLVLGRIFDPSGNNGTNKDELCKGAPYMTIFDLTNLKWLRSFEKKDEEYRVPKAVFEYIDGTDIGEAKMREPEGGFSSPGLARLFDGMTLRVQKQSDATVTKTRKGYVVAAVVMAWLSIEWLLW